MIEIGEPVVALDGFQGIVTARRGAPEGRVDHEVTSLEVLPRRRIYPEAELTVVPERDSYPVDSYGQNCLILEFDPDANSYKLVSNFKLPSNVEVGHLYQAVPSHHIDLWNVKPNARGQA